MRKRLLSLAAFFGLVVAPTIAIGVGVATRVNSLRLTAASTTSPTGTASNPVFSSGPSPSPDPRWDDGTNINFMAVVPSPAPKGTIPIYGGSNWVGLQSGGAGNDGKVLTADSTTASGWKLATGGGGGVSWPLTNGTSTNTYTSAVTDAANAVAHAFDNSSTFSTASTKLCTWANNTSVKSFIDLNGYLRPGSGMGSSTTIPPGWTNVTYSNSYVDFGAPYSSTAYNKDADGIVWIRLAAKSGTPAATIFTLPAGFRPGGQLLFHGLVDNAHGLIIVAQAGTVATTAGGNTNVISEIRFQAEN